ncbi:hypothetical protein [Paenibacillus sp.]|uniref:hypothetical protein n=1 Tax=Paenibacillus sp. TaxID=58172 RepID=UPI002836BE89|nr:hypothetical protein [Paenibacillus sp.]MDR0269850.1 hypothetical protein [Paenibacillus sp.]
MKKHSDKTHENTKIISLTDYVKKKKQEKNLVNKAVPFSKMSLKDQLETIQAMRDEDE